MPEFHFQAKAHDGSLIQGKIPAPDRATAIIQIEKQHGTPLHISLANTPSKLPPPTPSASSPSSSKQKLSHKQLLLFTQQLAQLLHSGMTLEKALAILSQRLQSSTSRALLTQLHQSLTEGLSFSQALQHFPQTFSPIYINMIAAGETSGCLPEILKRLAHHLNQIRKLIQQVQTALVYPAFLAGMGALLILVFVTFMVPQLTQFMEQTGQGQLPLPTRLLITLYKWGSQWWWVSLGSLITLSFLALNTIRTPSGRLFWDQLLLKLPGIGPLLLQRFSAQASRTLATLLQQGITLSDALALMKEIGGNLDLAQRIQETRRRVMDGASLSAAAISTQLFPPLFLDMLQVSEQSGQLAQGLDSIAEHYENEVENQVTFISTLIPILIILIIALVIGAVVFCILLAVFSVTANLKQSIA